MIQTRKYHSIIIFGDVFECYPFPLSSKNRNLSSKPVTCRPAQERSRHEPVTDCRPEPLMVVTDIPKRDIDMIKTCHLSLWPDKIQISLLSYTDQLEGSTSACN